MWKWLLEIGVIQRVVDVVLAQGITFIILILIVVGSLYLYKTEQTARTSDIMELRKEIKSCNDNVLQYYQRDRYRTDSLMGRVIYYLEHQK